MKSKYLKIIYIPVISALLLISCQDDAVSNVSTARRINNLKAFTKLYGYVRYFHPSDEASSINWNKFAILGIEEILNDSSDAQLESSLKKLFMPLAPTLKIYTSYEDSNYIPQKPKDNSNLEIVAWQYKGIHLSEAPTNYQSRRVYKNVSNQMIKNKLFDEFPKDNAIYKTSLTASIYCKVPIALYCRENKTIGENETYPLEPLKVRLNSMKNSNYSGRNLYLRIANVIITWNIIQHFYPYFNVVKVNWENVLTETLTEALNDKDADEFYNTLRKMIVQLQDGHGVVYYKSEKPLGGLPIRVEFIENQCVITATMDSVKFKKGDVIEEIDGLSADKILKEEEKYISGSSWLKRYRALNQFGNGEIGRVAKIKLRRKNNSILVEYERTSINANLFYNGITEFKYPVLKEMSPGIYYVNLFSIDVKTFSENLNKLAEAKGIIFDWRWDGIIRKSKKLNTLLIIRHLINNTIFSEKMNIPQVIYPDRRGLTFNEIQWPIEPIQPHFNGKVVFIDEPSVVSFGETIMGMVDYYKLGITVGDTTAGTNGDVNFIPLPGGYNIMWTGLRVLKNDGTQLQLVGFPPDIPVHKTINGVIEGRDEYLEKAIDIIKSKL